MRVRAAALSWIYALLAIWVCHATLAEEIRGSAAAPVALMVFSDFSCPYCARVPPQLQDLERLYPGEVSIVFKHLPLSGDEELFWLHEAAAAAGAQGAFWKM